MLLEVMIKYGLHKKVCHCYTKVKNSFFKYVAMHEKILKLHFLQFNRFSIASSFRNPNACV